MWGWLKRWFGGTEEGGLERVGEMSAPRPDLAKRSPAWIEAAESPFGVRVLDVRPMTLGMLSASTERAHAENVGSYDLEQGESFVGQEPALAPDVEGELRFRAPQKLVNGALFIPKAMEDKWALFFYEGELVVVRSWERKVWLRAKLEETGDELRLYGIRGTLTGDGEAPAFTLRGLDFLLRTCALEQAWPAPLYTDQREPERLARWCMNVYGRAAHYGLDYEAELPPGRPEEPMRTRTQLHLAVMKGEGKEAKAALAAGVPIDLVDGEGFAALHRAAATGNLLDLLLAEGASVDAVVAESGTTALMFAVQERNRLAVEKLLAKGASALLADRRGFTALHRAAEMGEVAMVKLLLAEGADPEQRAEGDHTPRSLAAKRGEKEILALFEARKS